MLVAFLAVTFLTANAQKVEKHGKKWINAKTIYGKTPLDLGISKGLNEIVDLLRKHDGTFSKKNDRINRRGE